LTPLRQALPAAGNPNTLTVWRLERLPHVATWEQGIGAEKVGGRWSPRGRKVIYTSLDPSTTILEVAVHAGFHILDTVAYSLLRIEILSPDLVHVVNPDDVPNPLWLQPGTVSTGMEMFGASLLDKHPFVLIPSVVSSFSWNLIIDVQSAQGMFKLVRAERFGLDGRLNKAKS